MKGGPESVRFSTHIPENIDVQQVTFRQCHTPGEEYTHHSVCQ
ncbi:hypothetical protein CSC35_4973 [Enterobacter hormaechei]|nr:hypothetical protein CSC35_4973 [Enterobacter hormaechei]